MSKDNGNHQQSSLYLRLFAGGYLLYTAWDLRASLRSGPVFGIAVAVFGLVGAALLGHSLWALLRPYGFFRPSEKDKADRE